MGMTTLSSSCTDCLEIWETKPLGTLRAFPGLHRNGFTLVNGRMNYDLSNILNDLSVVDHSNAGLDAP